MSNFTVAGGSIIGKDHRRIGKNRQDGYAIIDRSNITICVITDGCGDMTSTSSETGAVIGAHLIANTILRHTNLYVPYAVTMPNFWERIRREVVAKIEILATDMGGSLSETIKNHFLFTVLGILITEEYTVVFSIGDGVFAINGNVSILGPFPGNAPPYLAYDLLSTIFPKDQLEFSLNVIMPTKQLNSFLIGTDGLIDLIDASKKPIPGKDELVGPLSQFWTEKKYFENSFSVGRRLMVINKDHQAINWVLKDVEMANGHLHDDTTLVVGKRTE